ncbi:hypothetical protein EJ110_NYTH36489 [Nymphaea thermarum]|nr:hypothetical protein EJ110_NYTH36489 [Nymphaea thermarum]
MGSQKDTVLDAGGASKTENVPIQVTSIRLTKDNYLSWSAALEIGITSRGRLPYITGDKPPPLKSDPQWATWALEDSQVKVWIISFVSADIQPLILRKPTSFDMWTVLAKMYGRKKRHLRTYQIKRSIYSLKQGDMSVAAFYAALKTKWEELDHHVSDEWNCGSDHSLYWETEWMDRTFLFLGGLWDDFEPIRSQILNGDDIPGIEEVYARVESEEQRRLVMHLDASLGSAPSAFVSRASGTGPRPARRASCKSRAHTRRRSTSSSSDSSGGRIRGMLRSIANQAAQLREKIIYTSVGRRWLRQRRQANLAETNRPAVQRQRQRRRAEAQAAAPGGSTGGGERKLRWRRRAAAQAEASTLDEAAMSGEASGVGRQAGEQ